MRIPVTSGYPFQQHPDTLSIYENNRYSLIRQIKEANRLRRMEMLKAREILRQKHEIGLSLREIGQACNCGKFSVSEV
jgi:hypothetical protein